MRILLIQREPEIPVFLKLSLSDAGFEVDCAQDKRTALFRVAEREYDALIVDLSLPDHHGIDLIWELQRNCLVSPVLILSTSRSVDDRVKGLQVGGGDYATRPYAVAELIVRLRNLIRRSLAVGNDPPRLKIMDPEMDLIHRNATRRGEVLNLSPQKFTLLEYLVRHAGRVVTRSMLLSDVWCMRTPPGTNVVEVHIHRLRGKFDGNGREPLIQTLRGCGYLFRDK